MNIPKAFRMLILVISFLMFIWQASVALSNLMDPPVVDLTEKFNIDDIYPQLITNCPLNQFNLNKLQQFGYNNQFYLLMGLDKNDDFNGWGSHLNLTFEEIFEDIKNYDHINRDLTVFKNGEFVNFKYEIRFYPRFGYCYDLVNLTTNGEVVISMIDQDFLESQVYYRQKAEDKKLFTCCFTLGNKNCPSK